MKLINRCSACGLNYTPHGLDTVAYVMALDREQDRERKVALCEKCTRKLRAWLSGGEEGLEGEQDGQQKTEGTPDNKP